MKWIILIVLFVFCVSCFVFLWASTQTVERASTQTAERASVPEEECCLKPVYEDTGIEVEGKYLCRLQNYMGLFVDDPNQCHEDESIDVGILVTLAPVNKIIGEIGDTNMDGDCDKEDVPGFIDCLNGISNPEFNCFCTFDYNDDLKIDLRDYQQFQLAFGSGNTSWREETYGSN